MQNQGYDVWKVREQPGRRDAESVLVGADADLETPELCSLLLEVEKSSHVFFRLSKSCSLAWTEQGLSKDKFTSFYSAYFNSKSPKV